MQFQPRYTKPLIEWINNTQKHKNFPFSYKNLRTLCPELTLPITPGTRRFFWLHSGLALADGYVLRQRKQSIAFLGEIDRLTKSAVPPVDAWGSINKSGKRTVTPSCSRGVDSGSEFEVAVAV